MRAFSRPSRRLLPASGNRQSGNLLSTAVRTSRSVTTRGDTWVSAYRATAQELCWRSSCMSLSRSDLVCPSQTSCRSLSTCKPLTRTDFLNCFELNVNIRQYQETYALAALGGPFFCSNTARCCRVVSRHCCWRWNGLSRRILKLCVSFERARAPFRASSSSTWLPRCMERRQCSYGGFERVFTSRPSICVLNCRRLSSPRSSASYFKSCDILAKAQAASRISIAEPGSLQESLIRDIHP